jgi:hypothetical protein
MFWVRFLVFNFDPLTDKPLQLRTCWPFTAFDSLPLGDGLLV